MATPHYPVMPETAITMKYAIDLKANGEVSRMRSHKGNMPSLPQTKYCSLCPAKFTRTTHLNRHLRSHTNERLHRCNICHAEFTRSDLLTRHKRTCGDSSNANRSRRKSCQACAESKVKCNLQYPCSKCLSRGRECTFINDPEASRNKKMASKRASQRSKTPSDSGLSTSTIPANIATTDPQVYSNTFVHSLDTTCLQPQNLASSMIKIPPRSGLQTPLLSSGSSTSSSQSSPRTEFFDARNEVPQTFDLNFEGLAMDTSMNRFFPGTTYEPFMEQPSFSPCPPSHPGPSSEYTWFEPVDFYTGTGGDETFSFSQPTDDSAFVSPIDYATLPSTPAMIDAPSVYSLIPESTYDTSAVPGSEGITEPTGAELEQYLYLFFSAFSTQVPLIHSSTWKMEGKPYILIRAMQACGALFVKTRTAVDFITDTLVSTRDTLIQEFSKDSSDSREQVHLILAVVLLQTIGLFHQRADQRVSSNVYHGMLVMMIRRTSLLGRIGSWVPAEISEMHSVNDAWVEWAEYETIKRALFLSYLHDCCHCMYFSLSPSFQPAEFDINLPCDDSVWGASSAGAWLEVAQTPSAYGSGSARVSGVGMQRALAHLADMQLGTFSLTLNPFSHFILIHTILRNIHASRLDNPISGATTHLPQAGAADAAVLGNGIASEQAYAIQYALHNWLQMWLNGPESLRFEKNLEEPPFIYNALPFYWLAQASLLAVQDGSTALAAKFADVKTEGRFRLMKEWLVHIKAFLRSGSQTPTNLWDELTKIRGHLSQEDARGNSSDPIGLLSFFPGS